MSEKILVIDDDPSIVSLLRENLEAEGYDVVDGYDGQSAIDLARSERPNLVIMDVNLPGMTGPKALEALRQDSLTQGIPVIFLTGDASRETEELISDGALVTRLKKPFDLDGLNDTVKRMLLPAHR